MVEQATTQNSDIKAYFNQKPSSGTQNIEKATDGSVVEHSTNCELTLSALVNPSLEHILTCDTAFEHTCLRLILSEYLSTTDVENLNKTIKTFTNFHKMLSHAESCIVWVILE